MPVNIAETFELLFDKNNNVAYKALQELQKESEKTNAVYVYMPSWVVRSLFITHLRRVSLWTEERQV